MNATPEPIQHEENGGQGAFFIVREGKRIAELTYSSSGTDVVASHTWVDPTQRGGSLASKLVTALVDWVRSGNRKIVPVCSYVRSVFGRSSQYDDVWKK
jgi:predicted GNAT family acetyltransferase